MQSPQSAGRESFTVVKSKEDSSEMRLLVVPPEMADTVTDARRLGLDRIDSSSEVWFWTAGLFFVSLFQFYFSAKEML